MSILDKIVATKRREVAAATALVSLTELRAEVEKRFKPLSFTQALTTNKFPAIIAEIKRASPSKGVFRADLDPVLTAREYSKAGAACLSVLTDEEYFKGSLEFLRDIKKLNLSTPVLRKDFIIDVYQVWESAAAGADAILLIVAALSKELLIDLYEEAKKVGVDVLVEIHNESELEQALSLDAKLIGINNRDLNTFHTDISVTERLLSSIDNTSGEVNFITESGLRSGADLVRLREAGVSGFLIGESLVVNGNPGDNLAAIIAEANE